MDDDEIAVWIDRLVRARVTRRWRLDADVRRSAAHLAIAEALAATSEDAGDDFGERVWRRYLSELRAEARREARRAAREVSLAPSVVGVEAVTLRGETPEAFAAAHELAGLVARRARELGPRALRSRAQGCAPRGAGGVALCEGSVPASTRRRWRARAREALRGAARDVLGR